MPWTHALCPDGQIKTFDECLACNDRCFDLEICEALYENERNWTDPAHTGSSISATALTGCLRNVYLERIIDYPAAPASAWWSLRGKLIHKLVERPDMDNPYLRRSEIRLEADINGYHLSGQLDNYKLRFLDQGILKDWKSIGDNGIQYIVHDGAKQEHIWQTNIYAWLARQNDYRVDHIQIVYMSLMQIVATGTNTTINEYLVAPPTAAGKRKNMVGNPVLARSYPSGKKKWACTYRVPDVPVFPDEDIVAYIEPRLAALSDGFQNGVMPPVADNEIRKWKCDGYCHVRAACEAHEQSQGRQLIIPA